MALAPIPLKTAIVDKAGQITIFFRQRWEELRQVTGFVPAKGVYTGTGKTAAITTAVLYTVLSGGVFRVTLTARRTVVDGVSSSLQFVFHWTDGGVPLSDTVTANTTDTTGSLYTAERTFLVDGATNLTFDVNYASNTPAKMTYKINAAAEQLVQA